MKELLAKIRAAKLEQKCQLAVDVYAAMKPALDQIETLLDNGDLSADIGRFEANLDEMESAQGELEMFLNGLDSQEVKRVRTNLEKDYQECLELGSFYKWLNPDGRSYTADYAEFHGCRFEIPTQQEIQARLKPGQLKLYLQMEKEGLEPKLQITPIAFNIRTLGQKIDTKRAELKINTENTYVGDDIKDERLQLAPTSIKAINEGKEIEIAGGKTKSQWIMENQGYLIDIIPTIQNLEADPAIQKDSQGKVNHNAVQAEKYYAKLKTAGYTPLSYESYLLSQMRAIKGQNPTNKGTYTLLLDSNLRNSQHLAIGRWNAGSVCLGSHFADFQSGDLRAHGSVRIL